MNALVMLLPALSLAASAGVAQQEAPFTSPVARIVIAPHVRAELRALADTMELETVRCLIGVVAGDSAVIDLAWQPQIQEHSANTVRYRSCPLATIAHWHNHPWLGEGHPEDACYLSRTDIEDALEPHAPPLQFVQVNAGVMCWWTRLAIAQAEDEHVLLPTPGQHRPRYRATRAVIRPALLCNETDEPYWFGDWPRGELSRSERWAPGSRYRNSDTRGWDRGTAWLESTRRRHRSQGGDPSCRRWENQSRTQ